MLNKLVFGLTIACASVTLLAQTTANVQAPPKSSAYAEDGRGTVMRSGDGLCWRTGYWAPGDSVAGCDGELVPPITKPTAPAIAATPPSAPAATLVAAPTHCDFTVTLAGDRLFAFNNATLTKAAKNQIDGEVLTRLRACASITAILISGHSDRLGTSGYNQKLSTKRAASVAAYLTGKGISTTIETRGLGETQPLKSCSNKLGRKKLIACLAPNRRVVIEAQGIAK